MKRSWKLALTVGAGLLRGGSVALGRPCRNVSHCEGTISNNKRLDMHAVPQEATIHIDKTNTLRDEGGSNKHGNIGILCVNLGTPRDCTPHAVAEYLREFLSDSNVVQQPLPFRFILSNAIATFRSKQAADSYSKIWSAERGSPLLAYSSDFTQALRKKLEPQGIPVEMAMRYAEPNINDVIEKLKNQGCERIICLPMYPYETGSTTVTVVDAVKSASERVGINVDFVPAYWNDRRWMECVCTVTCKVLEQRAKEGNPFDHVVFSFHSVPLQHIRNMDKLMTKLGIPEKERNRRCYQASTQSSASLLANMMNISENGYSVSFQSRLGSQKWLSPSTEETLEKLAEDGVKRVAVLAPGFSVDNLETLEELQMEGGHIFMEAGGESLELIQCLNAEPLWVETVHDILVPYICGDKVGGDCTEIPSQHNVPYEAPSLSELISGFK